MLDEQEHILIDLAGDARAGDLALQNERVGIRHHTEIDEEQLGH
jgi:hypothetical protein